MSLVVYTVEQAAALLHCSPSTVEEWARTGLLAGLKPGGSWVFPAGALAIRLDELALEEAARRRKTPAPAAVTTAAASRRKARQLPRLVDLRSTPPGAA